MKNMKKKVVLFIGPPGSGKSTQAKILEQNYGWEHFSTGEKCRRIQEKPKTKNDYLIKKHMDNHEFVPNRFVHVMVERGLINSKSNHIILDGYPRNLQQMEVLDKIFSENEIELLAVIYFEAGFEVVRDRLIKRSELEDLSDDKKCDIRVKRWNDYEEFTASIVNYYRGREGFLVLNAEKTEENVAKILQAFFGKIILDKDFL